MIAQQFFIFKETFTMEKFHADTLILGHLAHLETRPQYDEHTFLYELGFDSLSIVNLIVTLCDFFNIDAEILFDDLESIPETISDLHVLENKLKKH